MLVRNCNRCGRVIEEGSYYDTLLYRSSKQGKHYEIDLCLECSRRFSDTLEELLNWRAFNLERKY